jgi:hypothetical protein
MASLVAYLTLLQEISANGPTDSNGLKSIGKKRLFLSEYIFPAFWTLYLLGFLHGNHLKGGANKFSVSPKGRVFLDLIYKMEEALDKGFLTDELAYVLNHLGLNTEVNGEATFHEVDIRSIELRLVNIFEVPKLTRFLSLIRVVREKIPTTFSYISVEDFY